MINLTPTHVFDFTPSDFKSLQIIVRSAIKETKGDLQKSFIALDGFLTQKEDSWRKRKAN